MMPRNKNSTKNLHDCSIEERSKHIHTCQLFWYEFIKKSCVEGTILDVGAGRGDGMEVIKTANNIVIGIDPLPVNNKVFKYDLIDWFYSEEYFNYDYDLVLAIDVIEHVEDDEFFLKYLVRTSDDYIFFTTPNWNVHQCKNHFHLREYTPVELNYLIKDYDCRFFEADRFRKIAEVDYFKHNSTANDFGVLISKG